MHTTFSNKNIQTYISNIAHGQSLGYEEAKVLFNAVLDGQVNEAGIASILTALKMKGESAQEIAGAAQALRSRTKKFKLDRPVVDTCGTGGDGSGSFNISTAAAIVAAGSGCYVAKHGNRSVTSRSGSADVLEALEVNIDLEDHESLETLEETGFGFFYAPLVHQSMKHVMPVRRSLSFRTIFNMIGPLCNPVDLHGQVIGVGDPSKLETMAEAGRILGLKRTLFVSSESGMDELTLEGANTCIFVDNQTVKSFQIRSEDVGLSYQCDSALQGGSAKDNAEIMNRVLNAEACPYLDAVVFNAGAALYVAGEADSIRQGVQKSIDAIQKGDARNMLNKLVEQTARTLPRNKRQVERAINRMAGM